MIIVLRGLIGPSFSCVTDALIIYSRILYYTKKFMVDPMTARCPGYVPAKQAQIITITSSCLTVSMTCLCWYVFHQKWCCALIGDCSRSLVVCSEGNLHCAAMFFFSERRDFFLETFFKIVLWQTLILNMLTEACEVWNVSLGFYTFTDHCQTDYEVNFLGCPLLERLATVFSSGEL